MRIQIAPTVYSDLLACGVILDEVSTVEALRPLSGGRAKLNS